jgi:hypothetical protein
MIPESRLICKQIYTIILLLSDLFSIDNAVSENSGQESCLIRTFVLYSGRYYGSIRVKGFCANEDYLGLQTN